MSGTVAAMSVSYTHLDVYKRQSLYRVYLALYPFSVGFRIDGRHTRFREYDEIGIVSIAGVSTPESG